VNADFSNFGSLIDGNGGRVLGMEEEVQGVMFCGGIISEDDLDFGWEVFWAGLVFLGFGNSDWRARQRAKATLFKVPLLRRVLSDLRTASKASTRLEIRFELSFSEGATDSSLGSILTL
jgi:hypothetical protein